LRNRKTPLYPIPEKVFWNNLYYLANNPKDKEKDESRDAEREIFKIMAEQNELRATLNLLKSRADRSKLEEEEYPECHCRCCKRGLAAHEKQRRCAEQEAYHDHLW